MLKLSEFKTCNKEKKRKKNTWRIIRGKNETNSELNLLIQALKLIELTDRNILLVLLLTDYLFTCLYFTCNQKKKKNVAIIKNFYIKWLQCLNIVLKFSKQVTAFALIVCRISWQDIFGVIFLIVKGVKKQKGDVSRRIYRIK